MFVKHRCPRRQQSQNMANISNSYILTPSHRQGHVMSVKCAEPIVELTVKFGYCIITLTLYIALCKRDGITERQTDGQTDGRTDDPITRCPRWTFQAGGIKNCCLNNNIHGHHRWEFGSISMAVGLLFC